MRRSLRIFPLYYSVVAICFVMPIIIPAIESLDIPVLPYWGLNYWLYLSNIWKTGPHPILGVTWSLAIEEQFYLIWPLVIFWLSRRQILNVCWCCIGVGLAYRLATEYGHVGLPKLALLSRIDMLAFGAFGAMMTNTPIREEKRRRFHIATAIAYVILVTTILYERGVWGRAVQTIGMSCMGLISISWILTVAHYSPKGRMARWFSMPLLRTLGAFSYAMYFAHSPMDAAIRKLIDIQEILAKFPLIQLPIQLAYTSLVTIASLGVSIVSWHAFEKHFLRLKKRYQSAEPSESSGHVGIANH